MTNRDRDRDRSDSIYEAHSHGDTNNNDLAEENDPLLIRRDNPSSVEAQAPPLHAKSRQTSPRFPSAAFLVPILILLVGFGTLGAGLTTYLTSCPVPPDQSEQIANLTAQLNATKASLNACVSNSTILAINLKIERMLLGRCQKNGRQLAERVEQVERDLERCTNQTIRLEADLEDAKSREKACETENDELRRQVKRRAYVDFKEFVGSLGTGGDSWVCSDTTQSWSYGYVSERTPHQNITIKTWTAELSDAQHSATPLVFPPPDIQKISPIHPSPPPSAYPRGHSEKTDSPEVALRPDSLARPSSPRPTPFFVQSVGALQRPASKPTCDSIYIIGYSVTSRNTSGKNGWWKISKMDKFGIKDGRIEFWALADRWYRRKALYDVQVWYMEFTDELVPT